ncbi:MAG: BatA and WFA domain-containing protein [Planctomycetota bacterium]|nr:BatA and WFA domain-containing protein [Planctomycetota bacterium]
MSFANPWGLLALVALPAIAAIHLFHRRYPRLEVSGLHLWGVAQMTHSPGRRRERLPITASLILELLAALILALALSRPQVDSVNRSVHLVVVLDGSASMSARRLTSGGDVKTFGELAVAELQSRIEELPSGSVVTLVESGRRPALLYGPRGDAGLVVESLQGWRPESVGHDVQPAWNLADQLAGEAGQLLYLTDTLPDAGQFNVPGRMEIVSLGEPQPNLAITAARWMIDRPQQRDQNEYNGTVHLRLLNLGAQATTATVVATSPDGKEIRTVLDRQVELAPGMVLPFEAVVPIGLDQLDIRLVSDSDAMDLDSHVRLIRPTARLVRVAVTLPDASVARQQVGRALLALPGWTPSGVEDADLVIGGVVSDDSATDPERWRLRIGPLDTSPAARKQAVDLSDRSVYVLEKRHPLLQGVVLGGVVWGGVQTLDFDFTPLITAGTKPLLVQKLGTRSTEFVLNIDLARSNFTDTPDWPILLSNLLEQCRDSRPGLRRVNYRVTEAVRFRLEDELAEGEDLLRLEGGERPRKVARARVVEIIGLARPAFYSVHDQDRQLARFAVNFQDIDESTLVSLVAGKRPPVIQAQMGGFESDSPYTWLILLAILVVIGLALGDWQVLRR